MNPPLPSEISAFEPPSPSEFPVTFRGGGMDIFWNHTIDDTGREGGGERMMKYWNALFNRGTKEAKKAFEANMHLTANCCEKR